MQKLFYPDSVAVVGASASPTNMGRNIVQNLIEWEYSGKIYPVNPRGETVLGLKGYVSLDELPDAPDLVVAFVPARVVPEVMDQCARAGVNWMAIPSSGFSEYGGDGEALTYKIKEKAQRHHIRFVGPNGLTVINAENGLCLPFVPIQKRPVGSISIISQSGGVGLSLLMFLANESAHFNKFISVGNKVDMDELDFLEYLGRDQGTKVICMFLESIQRGRDFLQVARGIDKPIIVFKANTTEIGARMASSHTASLVNDDAVIDDVFRQAGVFRVDTIKKLIEMARVFELPPMRGDRLAIVSPAGGYAVLLGDRAQKLGFEFPHLSENVLKGFKKHVRADVIRFGNPLDLGDILSSDAIVYGLDQVMGQEDIDGTAVVLMRRADARYDGAYSGLSREIYPDIGRLIKKHNKPLAMCLLTQCHYLRHVQSRSDYPIFETPEDTVESLAVLRDHYRRRPAGSDPWT
jgi:acetate---CoA ligase (ADP-forming)